MPPDAPHPSHPAGTRAGNRPRNPRAVPANNTERTPMRATTAGLALTAAFLAFTASRRAHRRPVPPGPVRCRVVVVGAGFGGLAAARPLANRPGIHLTVIDRHDHHLFQPLLYQVATAALVPTDIAAPVRDVLPVSPRVEFVLGEVTAIDTVTRHVHLGPRSVPYDELVVATGSVPAYFGHDGWAEAAPGLKTLDDALTLRRRILSAFEAASAATDPADRDRLLTFVLIGGGPNGVEMAGSVAELARQMLAEDFHLPGARARTVLIEAGPRILAEFAPELSAYARRTLEALGVEIRTATKVTRIEPGLVHTETAMVPAGAIVWTAGTQATPVAAWLGVTPGHAGHVPVGPNLLVHGHGPVAVIGDAAAVTGQRLPGLAPVAKQQGRYAARAILARLRGQPRRRPFRYADYGTLAAIGRNHAVAEFGPVHLRGFPAWLAWAVAHIFFLISFRNRVLVSTQWLLAYTLNRRTGRLLTGEPARIPQPPVANPGYKVIPPSTNNVAPVT